MLNLFPNWVRGGAERFTIDLCNELSKDHDVYMLVSHDLRKFGHYTKEISDRVHVISFNKKEGLDFSLLFKVYKAIKGIKPNVVHTHLMSIVYVTLCCLMYKKPQYFHTVHNSAKEEADGKIGTLFRRFLFKMKLVNAVTISNESKRSFVDYYGIDASVIFNGRDIPSDVKVSNEVKREIETYKVSKRTKVIIQLAHVGNQKRQNVMARVVNRLSKEGFDLCVLMIGTHDEQSMIDEIKSLHCERVHLLGVKPNPLEYLAAADAFGLTSSYEGLPISLIEAMGVGLVPVCTPVGGVIDLIKDGECGFLSASIEEEDYYIALKRYLMLTDDELAKMKSNVKDAYRPYTMVECARKYLKLFENEEDIR